MTPGARIQAAIEVLSSIAAGTSAMQALQHWGNTHRFAGSGDRRAIADTVYAVLRRYFAFGEIMGDAHPRALVLAWLGFEKGVPLCDIERLFCGEAYSPGSLREAERAALGRPAPELSVAARCNVPAETAPLFAETPDNELQLRAAAGRAPFDLRVNTLKSDRDSVIESLRGHHAQTCRFAPHGVRLPETVNLQQHPLYLDGSFEVQDEGSQLAAEAVDARPGMDVLDYCAGGGGKTLALAAAMENSGTLVAADIAQERLKSLRARALRAGVTCVQQLHVSRLDPAKRQFDRVLIDAPCTGTGTRRRNPDAFLRLSVAQVQSFVARQSMILKAAAPFVRCGGRLIYITCSLLRAENEAIAEEFARTHPDFAPADVVVPGFAAQPMLRIGTSVTGADAFFIAAFTR